METVLITGGSGLVGRKLTQLLKEKGYEVIWLSRERYVKGEIARYKWNYKSGDIDEEAIERADYIVHLAGANVGDGRWSKERKEIIVESRTETAKLLFETVKKKNKKLKAFITASAIGYYGNNITDNTFTEADRLEEPDFLAYTCRKWEESAQPFREELGIRTVAIRTGFVVSENSDAFKKMLLPTKLGIGSPLGSGRQYISWVHLDDLCNIYFKAVEDDTMEGAYNAVAPEYITNSSFMRRLAKTFKRPYCMPKVPGFVIKLMMGEAAGVVLGGSRISAEKILGAGYQFKYKTAKQALRATVDDIKEGEKNKNRSNRR